MRRLLIVAVLAFISTGSGYFTQVDRAGAVATVYGYLYHPTGNPSAPPPNQALMTCGWHTYCDDVHQTGEPLQGLDWISDIGGDHNVYVRLLMYSSGGQTQRVALAQFRTRYVGLCPQSVVYLKRYSDSVTIGTIVNQHSTYPSAADVPFYSSVSGYRNEYWAGTMVDPIDPCSRGVHTMQWYEWGLAPGTRNTAIKDEPAQPAITPSP